LTLPLVSSLSLHDALPIFGAVGLSFRVRDGTGRFPHAMTTVTLYQPPHPRGGSGWKSGSRTTNRARQTRHYSINHPTPSRQHHRSEEHTSELQSHYELVCR